MRGIVASNTGSMVWPEDLFVLVERKDLDIGNTFADQLYRDALKQLAASVNCKVFILSRYLNTK